MKDAFSWDDLPAREGGIKEIRNNTGKAYKKP